METTASPSPAEPPAATIPEDMGLVIRRVVRQSKRAALGTIMTGRGRPYVSLVTVATDVDGSPLLLLSRLADHTRNIEADPNVSLLFDSTEGYANPQEGPRVTLIGRIHRSEDPAHRRRFLARHPGAALYAGFADFGIFRVEVERAHWVGGFGRALWREQGLTCDASLAEVIGAVEEGIVTQLNGDQPEALTLMANRLLNRPGQGWRMVAIDPDGCDLALGDEVVRLAFDTPVGGLGEIRATLVEMAEKTRRKS